MNVELIQDYNSHTKYSTTLYWYLDWCWWYIVYAAHRQWLRNNKCNLSLKTFELQTT